MTVSIFSLLRLNKRASLAVAVAARNVEILHGVDLVALKPDLVMNVGARGFARVACMGDELPGRHLSAQAGHQFLIVPIESLEAQVMLDLNGPPQIALPVGIGNLARRGAIDIRAPPGGDVHAIVEGTEPGVTGSTRMPNGDVMLTDPSPEPAWGGIVDAKLLLYGCGVGALVGVQVGNAVLHDIPQLPQAGQARLLPSEWPLTWKR